MSRDKKDLHPTLLQAYEMASDEYKSRHPNDPQPFLTCTYRSNEEQLKLYNQPKDGKDNNGNGLIDEASEKVTQALPGQSPHNFMPSFAFDIGFINTTTQKMDWSMKYFIQFAECLKKVSSAVESGIYWKFKDAPHHELKGWKSMKHL